MDKYDPKAIEPKWQKKWAEANLYAADDKKKDKYYVLVEFPYPSGEGLHTGHVRSYTALDVIARKRRMEGKNVLYPIGWDAFGLPTENYALKTGIDPRLATKQNTDNFRRQLKSLGFSFDWNREVNTTDPQYYKWTQWMFIQFFKHGLAYKANVPINWCPKDKIGLANEEVVNGKCERCGSEVEKRNKEQWMIRITKYADRLLEGLKKVDYIERAKVQQENWIGRSEGASIKFKVESDKLKVKEIEIFTTRPDTIFGATFMVISPELANDWLNSGWAADEKVRKYIEVALKNRAVSEAEEKKEKTGVPSGIFAVNPANNEKIPVWISDYVLAGYGTGAIMAVPAHDERDFEFAKKFNLPIREVVSPNKKMDGKAFIEDGKLINSGKFDGLDSKEAKEKMGKKFGKPQVQYKLRDWVFSRQRYWGEPIPLIHCEKCGWQPVPDKDLPVELPEVENYKPTDTGESPLAAIEDWVNTKCPKCGGRAKRETDVMPNWAGSSWYFLRYTDPKNEKEFASLKNLKHWLPVDWYNGGMEHTTLHLLYSRFWNMFLHDLEAVPVEEPYKKRTSHGFILGEGGIKMSKSRGNVVNPDDIVKEFGADALRLYEMFIGPFDQAVAWDKRGILGTERFLHRVAAVKTGAGENKELESALHRLIKKVTDDIENLSMNTAVSALMIFVNACAEAKIVPTETWKTFLIVLAPFAPHLTEELWAELGEKESIHKATWPKFNSKIAEEEEFELIIQINGKTRGTAKTRKGLSEKEAGEIAEKTAGKWLAGKAAKKVIYVKDRLVNLITE